AGAEGAADELAERERRLINLFVRRRLRRGGPAFGVYSGDALAGAAVLTLPNEAPSDTIEADVAALAGDTWRALGAEACRRYDTYAAAADFFAPVGPHHHLNMIAVRPAFAGQGLARP